MRGLFRELRHDARDVLKVWVAVAGVAVIEIAFLAAVFQVAEWIL